MPIVSFFNPVGAQKTAFAKAVLNNPEAMQQKVASALTDIRNHGNLSSDSNAVMRDIALLYQFAAGTKVPANGQKARLIPSAIRSIIKDLKQQEQTSHVNRTVPLVDARAAAVILQQLLASR